ncbi:MAG: MFS transporter [Steroidobacteraceae bacterium]|nr:MFS transporter [Steroidobacteraceae bacterium]
MSAAAPSATPRNTRLVVPASAAGTAFEWYDFFIFVPLSSILARTFFAGLNDAAGYILALGAFAAGFAFRPLGALVFGRMGDLIGRKSTFLVTISMMGGATFAIGLLPTYEDAGLIAPVLFVGLRILQGLALGGEWGGAAIYIAEHAPAGRRGYLTSWMGSAAAFGLGGALLVTLGTRLALGEAAFDDWGWRVPFLVSAILLALSLWIRLKLHESPMFQQLRDSGQQSKSPYRESFGEWRNLKVVLVALFSMMVAQGAVWYTTFFYSQFFVERIVKVAPGTVNGLMIALVAASAPLYLFFGWLSDRIGRKPVMLAGMIVMALAIFPGFQAVTRAANPALVEAAERAPVSVVADPAECALQFDPIGKSQFRSSCDLAKTVLANGGIPYVNVAAPPGTLAEVRIGAAVVRSADGRGLDAAALAALKGDVGARVRAALADAGYPPSADPARADITTVFAWLMVLVLGATALYGPQAACLVELFPTRIRYTALSLPYHIGTGWVGGFLPATAYAMTVATGDIYYGLWYPTVAIVVSIVVTALFLPETRHRALDRAA